MVRTFAVMTVVIAGLGFAASASAADAKMVDCIHMARQVSSALEAATPGVATDRAKELARSARNFCSSNRYDNGVALYSKALTVLTKG